MNRIISDTTELDLYPDTVIATTLKAADVGDLVTRKATFTDTFKIPFTAKNHRFFGVSNKVQSDSTVPFVTQACKLIQEGIEVVRNGILRLVKTENFYSVNIFANTYDFFFKIRGKKLYELDMSAYDGEYTQSFIEANRNTTTGLIMPVMSYGGFGFSGGKWRMNGDAFIPSFYYHTIVDKIFEAAGYNKAGSVFSLDKYLKKIVAYSNSHTTPYFYFTPATSISGYNTAFTNERTAAAKTSAAQGPAVIGAAVKINFNTVINQDQSGYWNGTNSEYTPSEPGVTAGKIMMLFDFYGTLDITVSGGTIDIAQYENTTRYGDVLTNVGTGVHTFDTRTLPLAFPEGVTGVVNRAYTLKMIVNSGTPTVTINSGTLNVLPRGLIITGVGGWVFMRYLLPDMTQDEFIRDFAINHGLLFSEKDGTVHCKSLEEIIQDRAGAKNWTGKRYKTPQGDAIEFTPLSYGSKNLFTYTDQDGLVNSEFGTGSIDVQTVSQSGTQTIYDSPVAITLTNYLGTSKIFAATMDINFGTTSFVDPGFRVLLVRDKYSFEPAVTYWLGGSDFTDYKVAYFDDPDQANTMRWDQDLKAHYPSLTKYLQTAKLLKRPYYLTPADIAAIDFLTPIFDEDAYYLVNEVEKFIPNKITKVQLFKVS